MSRFGPNPEEFFASVYHDRAPWDIGGPQPALIELLRAIPPESPILDVGCGSGDLAITLAEDGYEVLGVDFVPEAIDLARSRAETRSAAVRERLSFRVADALQPSLLGQTFGAVVDSGFYHLFERAEGARFATELSRALAPGGRYYLLAFAVEFAIPNTPRAVSEAEVRDLFTPSRGWRVLECRAAELQSQIAPVPATCACVERIGARQ